MKSTLFFLTIFASGLAQAQVPVSCENFSGTYRMTCQVPSAAARDKTTESIAKAFVADQQVEIIQTGCGLIATSGQVASIGGLNNQSVDIPMGEIGNAKVSIVYSSTWQANFSELKSEIVGMVQVGTNEARSFWALS